MHEHDYGTTEVLTMDYVDVVCNGKKATSTAGQLAQSMCPEFTKIFLIYNIYKSLQ